MFVYHPFRQLITSEKITRTLYRHRPYEEPARLLESVSPPAFLRIQSCCDLTVLAESGWSRDLDSNLSLSPILYS
jgi:hypothetical protein